MVIDCRRNAGSKKNLSLARFWLNSEIGIHQMFSNALSESANTFTCSRIIHSQSRESCSRIIFCIMEGFFNQDHLEYWCICKQTNTLGRLNKLDKLQICIYDFVCVISKQHIGLIAGLITQLLLRIEAKAWQWRLLTYSECQNFRLSTFMAAYFATSTVSYWDYSCVNNRSMVQDVNQTKLQS